MGGGSSKPKYIDPKIIPVYNYKTNEQNLLNKPPENFIDYDNSINYYYILIIILIILFFSFTLIKRKKYI